MPWAHAGSVPGRIGTPISLKQGSDFAGQSSRSRCAVRRTGNGCRCRSACSFFISLCVRFRGRCASCVASLARAKRPADDTGATLNGKHTFADSFADAVKEYDAGRLPDAQALCRQILAREPQHADALHLLGMIAYDARQYKIAVGFINKAI